MNYFELFGIPVQIKVDKDDLARKYLNMSKTCHPDYFIYESPEKQAEVLERSATLNTSYKTLQKIEETIEYVLQLNGLLQKGEKYDLPEDFLLEVLEINEQLTDANTESKIANLQSAIYEPVEEIIENYKEGITTEKELLQLKEYHYKRKYLRRIQLNLSPF